MRLYRLWFIIIGMLLPIVTYGEENQTTPPPALWPPSPTGDNVKVIPDLLIRTLVQSAANETICDVLVDKGDVSDRSECGDMIEQRRGTIRWAAGAKPLNCGYSCIKRPVLKATEELDVPNFNFVQIEGTLKFELDVPVFSDRYLNTQIFLDFICREDGGFVRVNVGKPNISAPSFIEQLLPEQLINYIDAQIREELPSSDSGVAHFFG
ncbi:TPA: hypothetical protein O4I98_001352 [Vibrio parahaemolyticus]|nr:hypothetical protein [Vibrio parahaemolyticus]